MEVILPFPSPDHLDVSGDILVFMAGVGVLLASSR